MTGELLGGFNTMDLALLVYLAVIFPLYQLQASLTGRRARSSTSKRFFRTLIMLGLPGLWLTADLLISERSMGSLGFDVPIGFAGVIGLAIAATFIVSMPIMTLLTANRSDPAKQALGRARMEEGGLLLKTPGELALFLVMVTLIGIAGEVLFRGFLLWALTPFVGILGAVVIAALAYGVGHGFRSWRHALGSIVSAFAFTIAYALTHSVWWLILIHVFAGVYGGWFGYRLARKTVRESDANGAASTPC